MVELLGDAISFRLLAVSMVRKIGYNRYWANSTIELKRESLSLTVTGVWCHFFLGSASSIVHGKSNKSNASPIAVTATHGTQIFIMLSECETVDVMAGSTCEFSDLPRIKTEFERDGFVVVRDFVPTATMELWKKFTRDHFREIFIQLEARGHVDAPKHQVGGGGASDGLVYTMRQGVKNGFREIVMRSPGRFEVSLNHLLGHHSRGKNPVQGLVPPPLDLDDILRSLAEMTPKLLEELSWADCQLHGISYVVSTPGATEQSWHADGGHVDLHKHLPCHCVNVFLPVDDLTAELGPTEFRPGSQYLTRNLVPLMLAAKARKSLRPTCSPLPRRGDALIFDYRVLHRGKANLSTKHRTFLVFTVAKSWFKDVLNFPTRTLYEARQLRPDLS
jgi:Phytanoyl-CoA dioxygenase (PhyH)